MCVLVLVFKLDNSEYIFCCCWGLVPKLVFPQILLHIRWTAVFLLNLFFQRNICYLQNECFWYNNSFSYVIVMLNCKSTGALPNFQAFETQKEFSRTKITFFFPSCVKEKIFWIAGNSLVAPGMASFAFSTFCFYKCFWFEVSYFSAMSCLAVFCCPISHLLKCSYTLI